MADTEEVKEVEEEPRTIRVQFASGPTKTFKHAEYFVSQNRTLIIGAQVSNQKRQELIKKYGYFQGIATYNKDAWIAVEVIDEEKAQNPDAA